jgi:hypothetical protein
VRYRHTQRSFLGLVVVLVVVAVVGTLMVWRGVDPLGAILAAAVIFVVATLAAAFSVLVVEVDDAAVRAWFGSGWPKRVIPHAEIAAVRTVRNRWWHGWGVRWIRGGSMYNVSGFDAVELELRSGRLFRIGTDEPLTLARAIADAHGP